MDKDFLPEKKTNLVNQVISLMNDELDGVWISTEMRNKLDEVVDEALEIYCLSAPDDNEDEEIEFVPDMDEFEDTKEEN